MTFGQQQEFKVEIVKDLDRLAELWPFLQSGLGELNGTVKRPLTSEEFFLNHVDIVSGKKNGVILLVKSKNDKELAFLTGWDNTPDYRKVRSFLVYALYSNRKLKEASRFASDWIAKWAKDNGFSVIHCYLGRTSGSSLHWARRFHKLELDKFFMVREL